MDNKLLKYIQSAYKGGKTQDEVYNNLKSRGVSEIEILEALAVYESEKGEHLRPAFNLKKIKTKKSSNILSSLIFIAFLFGAFIMAQQLYNVWKGNPQISDIIPVNEDDDIQVERIMPLAQNISLTENGVFTAGFENTGRGRLKLTGKYNIENTEGEKCVYIKSDRDVVEPNEVFYLIATGCPRDNVGVIYTMVYEISYSLGFERLQTEKTQKGSFKINITKE